MTRRRRKRRGGLNEGAQRGVREKAPIAGKRETCVSEWYVDEYVSDEFRWRRVLCAVPMRAHLDLLRSEQRRHYAEHTLRADERRREQLPPPSRARRINSADKLAGAEVGESSASDSDGCGIASGPAGRLYAGHLHGGGVIGREAERGGGRGVSARQDEGNNCERELCASKHSQPL